MTEHTPPGFSDEQRPDPRTGGCPVCGRTVCLHADGRLAQHVAKKGNVGAPSCPGSGKGAVVPLADYEALQRELATDRKLFADLSTYWSGLVYHKLRKRVEALDELLSPAPVEGGDT